MHLFYAPDIEGEVYQLPEQEAKHAVKVLRLKAGDEVRLIDGKGGFYKARVEEASPKHCSLIIEDRIEEYGKRPFRIHMAVAPTKNNNRYEWFLEKATEMGLDKVTPLLTARGEKAKVRKDRLEKVLVAAMKQSVKAYLPELAEPMTLDAFLRQDLAGQKFIAHCGQQPERGKLMEHYEPGQDVVILIGPEGDFTPEELHQAGEKGYQSITLGNAILRTETAAVAACHTINLLNQ